MRPVWKATLLLGVTLVTARMGVKTPDASGVHCDAVCSLSVSCQQACVFFPCPECEALETTCGQYQGGFANDFCDGSPDYSCSYLCDSGTSPNTECTFEAQQMTCGEYGVSATCGDGICRVGSENCSECPEDCGSCPNVTENDLPTAIAVAEDIELAGYLDGSVYGLSQALNLAGQAGLIPNEDYSVDWADAGEPYGLQREYKQVSIPWWYHCPAKEVFVATLRKVSSRGGFLKYYFYAASAVAAVWAPEAALPLLSIALNFDAASLGASQIADAVERLPCFQAPQ